MEAELRGIASPCHQTCHGFRSARRYNAIRRTQDEITTYKSIINKQHVDIAALQHDIHSLQQQLVSWQAWWETFDMHSNENPVGLVLAHLSNNVAEDRMFDAGDEDDSTFPEAACHMSHDNEGPDKVRNDSDECVGRCSIEASCQTAVSVDCAVDVATYMLTKAQIADAMQNTAHTTAMKMQATCAESLANSVGTAVTQVEERLEAKYSNAIDKFTQRIRQLTMARPSGLPATNEDSTDNADADDANFEFDPEAYHEDMQQMMYMLGGDDVGSSSRSRRKKPKSKKQAASESRSSGAGI